MTKSVMLGEISARELHGPWSDFMGKLQGENGREWFAEFKRFLRKEPCWVNTKSSWREEDGIIYFSVTSDGTTGEEWITRLEKKGFRVGDYAKRVLRSKDFKPTSGITTEIAILKGILFEDNDRIMKKICAFAVELKLEALNAEVACLIREMFTDEEIEAMGLWWIVAVHELIKDSGDPFSLIVNSDGRWLDAYYGKPDFGWLHDRGFAFAVSQVSSQT